MIMLIASEPRSHGLSLSLGGKQSKTFEASPETCDDCQLGFVTVAGDAASQASTNSLHGVLTDAEQQSMMLPVMQHLLA